MKYWKSLAILFLPIWVPCLGVLMNALACAANHGQMPFLLPPNSEAIAHLKPDWNHIVMTGRTHLNFLADWIVTNSGLMSPGDVLETLGDPLEKPALLGWLGSLVYLFKRSA